MINHVRAARAGRRQRQAADRSHRLPRRCSRVLCHGEFFFEDSTESLIQALRSALYKRGTPEQIYADNGSNYSSQKTMLICARLGCILRHTPVRDGAAKGKVERFFRRVRYQFLCRKLDLSSLACFRQLLSRFDGCGARKPRGFNTTPLEIQGGRKTWCQP